jgi:hypothetical protein
MDPNPRFACAAELAILENDETHCEICGRVSIHRGSERDETTTAISEHHETNDPLTIDPEAPRQGRLCDAVYARWYRRCAIHSLFKVPTM